MHQPFNLLMDAAAFANANITETSTRRLSEMPESFLDQDAVAAQLKNSDPVIYDVHRVEDQNNPNQLSTCITVIYPGSIAKEFYMTKGHFHLIDPDGDEFYFTVRGEGRLLLQSPSGESEVLPMTPGTMSYIPVGWGHRTVNVGDEPFIFVSIWPKEAGHDYEKVVQRGGFPKRVMQSETGPLTVDNPIFQAK